MKKSGTPGLCVIISLLCIAALVPAFLPGCGKSPDSLYTEGKTLIAKPETQEKGMMALEKFEKKFPDDPRAPEVMLAIAAIHQSEKRFSEAETKFMQVMEKYPGSPAAYKGMFLLGYMYYDDIKDTDKAKEILNKFVAAYPDSGLAVSAKVLLENIGRPVEQWSTVKNIMTEPEAAAPAK